MLHNLRDEKGERRYSDDQITGMFISMMFAGHHTTSVTSSWAMIDLLQHPEWARKVVAELDQIYADGRDVSYQALREIPLLECALKESLRLHPPLIILMRKAMSDFHYEGWTVPAGHLVAASPAISNRMPEHFPEPDAYRPERYGPGREEDRQSFAWIPFGAGRHRCVGAAFAMMQLKAIFSILLRNFEFELSQPAESYANDLSKMVVAVKQPCRARYRRRRTATASTARSRRPRRPQERRRPAGRSASASTPTSARATPSAWAKRPRCSTSSATKTGRTRSSSACNGRPQRFAPRWRPPSDTARSRALSIEE